MINLYTVIGQPVAHSMSPQIHQLFGELTQRKLNYTRTEATSENFNEVVQAFKSNGGHGCNITVPFKQQALDVVDRMTPAATQAQAINTIHMHRDGSLVGHNTDGSGLLADLQTNLRLSLHAKKILLLGAGGAARGCLAPLLATEPALVHIANRTVKRAEDLACTFSALGPISTSDYSALADIAPFDLVVNATSMSLHGKLPDLSTQLFARGALSYDMMYAQHDTVFMTWSRQHGATQVTDGFGMLIEQAADAFLIWEDVRPKTRMLYPQLRDLLSQQR